MMCESRFSMGIASRRSRPLPWGTPSMMSMSTTSASSLEAIQWAAVAPTFPEPTIVTFFRMNEFLLDELSAVSYQLSAAFETCPRAVGLSANCQVLNQHFRSHVLDDVAAELAGLYFGCPFHQALEIIGDFLLFDGALY